MIVDNGDNSDIIPMPAAPKATEPAESLKKKLNFNFNFNFFFFKKKKPRVRPPFSNSLFVVAAMFSLIDGTRDVPETILHLNQIELN